MSNTNTTARFDRNVEFALRIRDRLFADEEIPASDLNVFFSLITEWCVDAQRINWLESQVLAVAPVTLSKSVNPENRSYDWQVSNLSGTDRLGVSLRDAIDNSASAQSPYEGDPAKYRVLY